MTSIDHYDEFHANLPFDHSISMHQPMCAYMGHDHYCRTAILSLQDCLAISRNIAKYGLYILQFIFFLKNLSSFS